MATDANSTPASAIDRRTFQSRRALAIRIEELIALLDDLDGDPDLEDGCDAEPDQDGEPTLGWPESIMRKPHLLTADGRYAEMLGGESEDNGDSEPSLGSLERHPSPYRSAGEHLTHQLAWGFSSNSDREFDGDDLEPEQEDGEGEFSGGTHLGADKPTVYAHPEHLR